MNVRLKKFIGTILMIILVVLYSLVAVALAVQFLPGTPVWWQLTVFAIGGIFWIVPAMVLIKWMARLPDEATYVDPSNK
ncbi:MAG: DUF2842 domain-containing protein [Pseudomonadota bacterium]